MPKFPPKNLYNWCEVNFYCGQWLWLCCQSCRFLHQRSSVRIQSLTIFHTELACAVNRWKDNNKEKRGQEWPIFQNNISILPPGQLRLKKYWRNGWNISKQSNRLGKVQWLRASLLVFLNFDFLFYGNSNISSRTEVKPTKTITTTTVVIATAVTTTTIVGEDT